MKPSRRLGRAFAIVGVTLVPLGQAAASGFAVARFGGEHGHPTTDNPTALFFNPAGLSLGAGTRLYLDGTFAYRSVTYDRPAEAIGSRIPAGQPTSTVSGTPAGDEEANSGEGKLFNLAGAPFAAVVTDFGVPNLGVGLGFYVPYGGAAVWDKVSLDDGLKAKYPGAEDGSNRWWSIEGSIRSMYVTAGGAYRIPDLKLSFGLGVSLVLSEVNTVRARNSTGGDELVSQTPRNGGVVTENQEGRSLVDVTGTSIALGGGVIWEAMDGLFIGASYQSQPGFGEMKLEGTLDTVLASGGTTTQDIDFYQSLPDVFRLGARMRPSGNAEIRLDGEYYRWSLFTDQCLVDQDTGGDSCKIAGDGTTTSAGVVQNVKRDWDDAFAVHLGGSYWVVPDVEIFGGARYDSNAVPDRSLDPALTDFDDVSLALGAKVHLLDRSLALAGSYTQFIYFEREIAPADSQGYPAPSAQPNSAGTYNQSIGVLNINAEYTF